MYIWSIFDKNMSKTFEQHLSKSEFAYDEFLGLCQPTMSGFQRLPTVFKSSKHSFSRKIQIFVFP